MNKGKKDLEAMSHASYGFVRVGSEQLTMVLESRMVAQKKQRIPDLEDYFIASESFFDSAYAGGLVGKDEAEKINKRLEAVKKSLRWLRIEENARLNILFPQPKIDYSYRRDEIFITKPKPVLPLEYTTSYLGNFIIDELRAVLFDTMTQMQSVRQFWVKLRRHRQKSDLGEDYEDED